MLEAEATTIGEREEIIDGRRYIVKYSPDIPAGAFVTVGPPHGLVDELGLPKDVADRLHQILFDRKLFSYKDISNIKVAMGVIQDVFQVDAQKLVEAFYNFEKETL